MYTLKNAKFYDVSMCGGLLQSVLNCQVMRGPRSVKIITLSCFTNEYAISTTTRILCASF